MKYLINVILFLLTNCWILLSDAWFVSDSEDLLLLPSIAFPSYSNHKDERNRNISRNHWILHIQGWFFKENPYRAILATSILSTIVDDIDSRRVSYLTASGRSHQTLCLQALRHDLCAHTDKNGLFHRTFEVHQNEIEGVRTWNGFNQKISYSLSTKNVDIQSNGEIFLCEDEGISIISDIDDTIKITGVTNLHLVLRNTFTNKYKAVQGMAQRYRHYQSLYNATFHYLTASPDQLYPFLREFFDQESFPMGSFHMRHLTWMDSNFLKFFRSSSFIQQKGSILEMFFQQTINRTFVLFGDIFQKDPEIYSEIYRKYPHRIRKIFIRISKSKVNNRLKQVFQDIPNDKWTSFFDGRDLPDRIF